ncbi:hypothetical protein EVAR_24890_1 [Eumeta japonica]|uniref:Uncharacterized protein n=1 Tax=Eumeta variegata TaxID=151549 RepID=A0A4C1V6F3_EUMVA|nr:hypothetical protein EVAR_24890_1 [Eumeta japonica]
MNAETSRHRLSTGSERAHCLLAGPEGASCCAADAFRCIPRPSLKFDTARRHDGAVARAAADTGRQCSPGDLSSREPARAATRQRARVKSAAFGVLVLCNATTAAECGPLEINLVTIRIRWEKSTKQVSRAGSGLETTTRYESNRTGTRRWNEMGIQSKNTSGIRGEIGVEPVVDKLERHGQDVAENMYTATRDDLDSLDRSWFIIRSQLQTLEKWGFSRSTVGLLLSNNGPAEVYTTVGTARQTSPKNGASDLIELENSSVDSPVIRIQTF